MRGSTVEGDFYNKADRIVHKYASHNNNNNNNNNNNKHLYSAKSTNSS